MHPQIRYFASSLANMRREARLACPSCGSTASRSLQRKYVVTALRRCEACRLMYRTPTTSHYESSAYYQDGYHSGFTTELPDERTLATLVGGGFKGSAKDFTRYIAVLTAIGVRPGARVLDYGSSWGYGAWQFRRAGFDVTGYEVSEKRASYASQRLGVRVTSSLEEITGQFDVVFSAHVLEHVPNPRETIGFAMSRLAPQGYFIAITPNGSIERRRIDPGRWSRAWGLKHPNLLDKEFYRSLWGAEDLLLTTELGDLDAIAAWAAGGGSAMGPLDGGELLAIGRRLTSPVITSAMPQCSS